MRHKGEGSEQNDGFYSLLCLAEEGEGFDY